jgi:hypothetical protein
VIRLSRPKNSESQAASGSRNASKGVCNKNNNHKRLLHWRDVQDGNLDCDACDGQYVVRR